MSSYFLLFLFIVSFPYSKLKITESLSNLREHIVETISSKEMKALEMNSEYFGVSRLQMMESAGKAVAEIIDSKLKNKSSKIIIFAGTGGNGGDGFVAARYLTSLGHKVNLHFIGRPEKIKREEVKKNWNAIRFMHDSIKTSIIHDSSLIPKNTGKIVVDALLGIGATSPLRPPILYAVKRINEMRGFKVAIDVPTGVNADTGVISNIAVKANLTITFHKPKEGLLKAKEYTGKIKVSNIGIPKEAERYIGPGDVFLIQKPRLFESHKGDYGRLIIVGGSEIYSGAPVLAALAALRVGIDIVYIAAPIATAHDIASMFPSLITVKLEGNWLSPKNIVTVKRFIERSTAVVIGPGLGTHKETYKAVKELIEFIKKVKIPLLLDADGLKTFSEFNYKISFPCVLTPHSKEFQIMTGTELPLELDEKVLLIKKKAKDLGAVILLKGPIDIVSNGKQVKLNRVVHNPGMTVGGTGDVLSGIVGALLSQGFDPFQSAVAGTFVNGAAGDYAVHERGYHILPTDLIKFIPKIIDYPMSHREVRRRFDSP